MRGMLRKSGAYGARERKPRSVRLGEGRRVGGKAAKSAGKARPPGIAKHGAKKESELAVFEGLGGRFERKFGYRVDLSESFQCVELTLCMRVEVSLNCFSVPVSFQERGGWTFLFSPLCTGQIREEHAKCGSQGPLYLFDPCRLGLFLASCAKGSNRSNFPWIRLPRWPRWELASCLCGACKRVSEFHKLPSRQCSASRVLENLLRFLFSTSKSSSSSGAFSHQEYWECQANIPRGSWWHAMWACASLGAGAAGSRSSFETFISRSSCIGRSSNLPMR